MNKLDGILRVKKYNILHWWAIWCYPSYMDCIKQKILEMQKEESKIKKVLDLTYQENILNHRGEKQIKKRFLAEYILIQSEFDTNLFYRVTRITGVKKFLTVKDFASDQRWNFSNIEPDVPSYIPDTQIQNFVKQIKKHEDERFHMLEKDEAVQIISGPFKGFMGKIIEKKSHNRFVLEIKIYSFAKNIEILGNQIVRTTE